MLSIILESKVRQTSEGRNGSLKCEDANMLQIIKLTTHCCQQCYQFIGTRFFHPSHSTKRLGKRMVKKYEACFAQVVNATFTSDPLVTDDKMCIHLVTKLMYKMIHCSAYKIGMQIYITKVIVMFL